MVNENRYSEPEIAGSKIGDILIHSRESLLNRLAGVRPSLALNESLPQNYSETEDLAVKLKKTLDRLKIVAMDESGSAVDYAAIRKSTSYAAFRNKYLAALQKFKPSGLPDLPARRAFWVNLYNALVLDAVINFGIQNSVTEGRLGLLIFFRRAAYIVDGQRVSLEDIEHGILRANRGNPYVPGNHFATDDPRLAWSLPLDSRVHFALNCGGRSCPPIRSYSGSMLDEQLDLAARSFVSADVDIRPERMQILLSRIFQWYMKDFGGRAGLLNLLVHCLPEDQRRQFLINNRDEVKLQFKSYDWNLNGV